MQLKTQNSKLKTKILAFAGSNSKNSINKKLVTYATSLLENAEIEILDLNDYEMPIFSVDLERELGKPPQAAADFLAKITNADAVVISFAEHNGNYAVAYKNIFDWCSRIKPKVYADKKMLVLAASTGPGGAKAVLKTAENSMPHFHANLVASFSLPSFNQNFDTEQNKIIDKELDLELRSKIKLIES